MKPQSGPLVALIMFSLLHGAAFARDGASNSSATSNRGSGESKQTGKGHGSPLGAAGNASYWGWLGYYPVVTPGGVMWVGNPGMPPPVVVVRGPVIRVGPQDSEVRRIVATPAAVVPKPSRPADPERASQLVTIGDRLFRLNNTKRAEERYLQAVRSDPRSATPRVRLAEIALVRGNYAEAAHRLREADLVEPGWLLVAKDIQNIYGEPADFHRPIERLEAYLHAHPEDRDAWFVLGAQWYLSGRTSKSSDIFRRLNDPHHRPDRALAAFISATNADAEQKVTLKEPPAPPWPPAPTRNLTKPQGR